jgi:hypothetical protein
MATEKQFEANRLNAQKSTGPRTPEGRAAVRLNGVTHGLTAETIVLKGESEADFTNLLNSLEARSRQVAGRPKIPLPADHGKRELIPFAGARKSDAFPAPNAHITVTPSVMAPPGEAGRLHTRATSTRAGPGTHPQLAQCMSTRGGLARIA